MSHAMREYSWGPTFTPQSVRFRLWAPVEKNVSLWVDGETFAMSSVEGGWFEVELSHWRFGSEYGFVTSDGLLVPDPASRRQSDVLAPSILVDPNSYEWVHGAWNGRRWEEAVFYELHIGTFTREGTFRAAIDRLRYLADIGFTAIEIMPLAQFPGKRGWGYDGVYQYAPQNVYGSSDDLKALVDAAHGLGLMVFLDVVYNHFGPTGNFLPRYAPSFFHEDNPTPWGARIDFGNQAVRRFFIENSVYWLTEFRLDGLRLDAVDQIVDKGDAHFLKALSEEANASVAGRQIHLITENPANGTDLMAERKGRRLFEADWNDDFHHALHSAVTGENTGYYEPLSKEPWKNTARALAQGYLREGNQIFDLDPPPAPALPTTCFVHFLQNHDQVGNRAMGDRLHLGLDPDLYAALTAMLILSPQIPLFFQGDDHLSTRPFRFFADYTGQLRGDAWKSRAGEAENFGGLPSGFRAEDIPDPSDIGTFEECKLDWGEADRPEALSWRTFLSALLSTRRNCIVPLLGPSTRGGRIMDAPERCIFVDWEGASGVLKLRANLSTRRVAIERRLGVEIFPGASADDEGWLDAYSVKVFRDDNHPRVPG